MKKNFLHPPRKAKVTADAPMIPEPLPLQSALVDDRHLLTSPWVRAFQRLLEMVSGGGGGGGTGGGPGGDGPPGEEHAVPPAQTTFTLDNPYYKEDGTGQMTLYLPFHWVRPPGDDTGYLGSTVYWIDPKGNHRKLSDLVTGNGTVVELHEFPVSDQDYWDVEFYLLSSGATGENTYDPAVTPRILTRIYGPQLTVINVDNFHAALNYTKDEFGVNCYYFSGGWNAVNKALNPRWAGVKVLVKSFDVTKPVKYVTTLITENPGNFKSETYPLQQHESDDFNYFYLYAVSVDVNGKENSYVASPRAGPLILTGQGGTIKNEALPDLDVGNFAAGLEPVKILNTGYTFDPSTGYLPASIAFGNGNTTTIYNYTDKRLYRWDDSVNRYKVIGTATDIIANSIVAGQIQAGAVSSYQMAAQEIYVGPLPNAAADNERRPIAMKVAAKDRTLIGVFGDYLNWQGIYSIQARFGPLFTAPTFEATSQGVFIRGTKDYPAEFQLTSATGDVIRMHPEQFDPSYSTLTVKASDSGAGPVGSMSNQSYFCTRGLVLYGSKKDISNNHNYQQIGALARNPNYQVGEVVLYDDSHIQRVLLTCVDVQQAGPPRMGIVRSDRFDCGSFPGLANTDLNVSLAGGGSFNIKVRGGIIVS